MSILSRLRALRSHDAACARALFAGQGLPPGAAAGQQALARLLEVAAGPGSAQELADEVAAAAAFVQVTSQVKPRKTARRILVTAACAIAVGGTALYTTVVPSPHHKMTPVPFGVPAAHPTVLVPAATTAPSRPPGSRQAPPKAHTGHQTIPARNRSVPPRPPGR